VSTDAPVAAAVVRTAVGTEPLDVAEHAALVEGAASGAVVTFAGVVRDHDHGRSVAALDYEAHPSAGEVLARVVAAVVAGSPGVSAVAVSHRVGPLAIGVVAVAVAVAAPRRRGKARPAGVEAPGVRRRLRGMGQLPLSGRRPGTVRGRATARAGSCSGR
jgi:molybdopterin synthase catalytic subunit